MSIRPAPSHHTAVIRHLAAGLVLCLAPATSRAEDVVHLSTGDDAQGRTKAAGEIVDYTGSELVLRLAGGAERSFPAARVLSIETSQTREQVAADVLFDQGKFKEALVQYQKALNQEQRTWMRRQIAAQLVWTERELGDLGSAGDYFLLLIKSDPATQFFDAIPLAWLPGQASAELQQKARRWLAQSESPAANLLGASHLLATAHAAEALARLKQLTAATDPRVAGLAKAQTWRNETATASPERLVRWRDAVERLPEPLRAGPYFVLGRALVQQKQHEQAAIALMYVPILYPRERTLSARALLEAGRALEKLDQRPEAAGLYRELLADHPDDPSAAEAQVRLEELAARQP